MANEKRLIDAFTLAEEIESLTITVAGKPARWNDAKHSVLCVLAEQPDVDAVEVVHARWVERRYDGMGGGWYALFHCSECDTPSAKPRNFCSFCGAKMDGEGKDNDIRRP